MFLTIPKDRIIIVDPMGEYAPLVRRLGGQVVEIAPGSPSHINPMDIQLDLDDDESPLSMKADFCCPCVSWWWAARTACSPSKNRD